VLSSLERLAAVVKEPARQLKAAECHGRRDLFERDKGSIQIEGNPVGHVVNVRILCKSVLKRNLEKEPLGVACTEVKAEGFQHKPLEADDTTGSRFKYLKSGSVYLSLPKVVFEEG
jgi:hypothetical protein